MGNFKKGNLERQSTSDLYLSKHITVDFYGCDNEVLLNADLLEKTLINASISIGANVIKSDFHNFEPQGVSGVVVLAESHMTIHSWPEYGYAAVDIFACGDMNFKKGINLLRKVFKPKTTEVISDLKRGIISKFKDNLKEDKLFLDDNKIDWETQFNNSKAWGIASSVDIYGCDPDIIRDSDAIKRYVKELCELIEMKRFKDTEVVNFGEDERVAGFSMTQLIETSLISGHFANKTNVAYLDIFSCKYYNPSVMAEFTIKFFKGEYYKLNVNLRDEK